MVTPGLFRMPTGFSFASGMKRYNKPNNVKLVVQDYLPDLTGSIYYYGRIGSGKSVSMLSMAQKYHDAKGYKIFDVYGGERNEHLFWCFPSDEESYWNNAKKLFNLDSDGAKQYQVSLLYPYYKKTTPLKLPFDAPNIRSSIFTIPFSSVEVEDIYLSSGLLSETDKFVLRQTSEAVKRKDSARRIQYLAKSNSTKVQTIFRNFFLPLTTNLLLQSDFASTNLDINKEFRDRKTITILCTEFIPKEFRLFVIGWFIRQLSKKLDSVNRVSHNLILMREVAEFFRATDDSVMPDTYKMFRKQLSNFLRYGRKGLHFLFDAQSPDETKNLVDGQQDLTVLGKLPGENDRQKATDQLRRDGLITQKQIAKLAVLEPGQMMFCETGKHVTIKYISLPRTMFWKPGSGNFYKHLWVKKSDRWKDNGELLEELENKWKEEDAVCKAEDDKKAEKKVKSKDKEKEDKIREKIKAEKEERSRERLNKIEANKKAMEETIEMQKEIQTQVQSQPQKKKRHLYD